MAFSSQSKDVAMCDLKPLEIGAYDSQAQSHFFSGLIPAEIRLQIFELALQEFIITGDDKFTWATSHPPPHFPSSRSCPPYQIPREDDPNLSTYIVSLEPGEVQKPWNRGVRSKKIHEPAGRRMVSTSLLRTCKRIYVETKHLPYINKEHIFWHYAGPTGQPYDQEDEYFARFRPDQLRMMKSIHMVTQQFWLERGLQNQVMKPYMQGFERLHITMRSGDWWFCERNHPLALDPQQSTVDQSALMTNGLRKEGPWRLGGFGYAIQQLSGLKELVMEFITFGYKEGELAGIVRRAQRWQFERITGGVLSAKGIPVVKQSYEGSGDTWALTTPYCRGHDGCDYCEKMTALKKEGRGPMLISLTVTWKLVEPAREPFGQ